MSEGGGTPDGGERREPTAPAPGRAPEAPRERPRLEPDRKDPAVPGHKAALETGQKALLDRKSRKARTGLVTSTKMDKTIVVTVTTRQMHPKYGKTVQRSKKLYVHDPLNEAEVGDKVLVHETKPISKLKRWRLVEIVQKRR